jgi:hypothetical protein
VTVLAVRLLTPAGQLAAQSLDTSVRRLSSLMGTLATGARMSSWRQSYL